MERIYGIKEGRPEKLPNYSVVKSQSDLATQMGISVDTLQNYKLLADMIVISIDTLNLVLDKLSSTEFQYVTKCHVLKQLLHWMVKTISYR